MMKTRRPPTTERLKELQSMRDRGEQSALPRGG
jgi:hypothetical protein